MPNGGAKKNPKKPPNKPRKPSNTPKKKNHQQQQQQQQRPGTPHQRKKKQQQQQRTPANRNPFHQHRSPSGGRGGGGGGGGGGGSASAANAGGCFSCGEKGHRKAECPQTALSPSGRRQTRSRSSGGAPAQTTRQQRKHSDDGEGQDRCFACGELGHMKRDCPLESAKKTLSENPARVDARQNEKLLRDLASIEYGPGLVFLLVGKEIRHNFHQALIKAVQLGRVQEHVVPLLRRLGRDDAIQGMEEQIYELVVSLFKGVPGLVGALATALLSGAPTAATSRRMCYSDSDDSDEGLFAQYHRRSLDRTRTRVSSSSGSSAIENRKLLCWFLTALVGSSSAARRSEEVKRAIDDLCNRDSTSDIVQLATLRALVDGDAVLAKIATAEAVRATVSTTPGGRHDNDHRNYRDIQTEPTVEELRCSMHPHLPARCSDHTHDVLRKAYARSLPTRSSGRSSESVKATAGTYHAAYLTTLKLDRQYRLLREDFIGPIRQTLREVGTASSRVPAYHNVELRGVCGRGLTFAMPLPQHHRAFKTASNRKATDRAVNKEWEVLGSRTLAKGCMVAVMEKKELLRIGTVSENSRLTRDSHNNRGQNQNQNQNQKKSKNKSKSIKAKDRGAGPAPLQPMLHTCIDFDSDVEELLKRLSQGTQLTLVEICSGSFSVTPVLRRLQRLQQVPLAEELLLGQDSLGPPEYLKGLNVERAIQRVEEKHKFRFDEKQRHAVKLALTNRVSLTQGPPGTGKTFVGAKIAEILLSCQRGEGQVATAVAAGAFSASRGPRCRLLVVCETNHALDDFLMDLIKLGVGSGIVRVGGRCKVEALEPYTLGTKSRASDFDFTKGQAKSHYELKNELRRYEQELEELEQEMIGDPSWAAIKKHLRSIKSNLLKWLDTPLLTRDGFSRVNKAGRALRDDYLLRRWLAGKDAGAIDVTSQAQGLKRREDNPWTWARGGRHALHAKWVTEMTTTARERCAALLLEIKKLRKMVDTSHMRSKRAVLLGATVIGCTTTGASIYSHLLESVPITTVIIEEAGEVLEAHVLASLTHSVQHLILIGDHQQLRPKVENYELAVDNTRTTHNFNVSLFERLVEAHSLPFGKLERQHRMRPEISALIRPFYRELEDADKTKGRPDIRGLASNIVFINHDHNEKNAGGRRSRNSSGGGGSSRAGPAEHVNTHEVEMICATTTFLLQQKYNACDLVILTPYVAQLQEIRLALSKTEGLTAILNERDAEELAKQFANGDGTLPGGNPANNGNNGNGGGGGLPPASSKQIRVATVDNFQGEESKIVLLSLVRCNPANNIGFLHDCGRVTVMLSRARDGFIALGSRATLTGSSKGRKLWNQVFQLMDTAGQVVEGLPTKCATHGTVRNLCTPAEFREHSPNGGCSVPCGARLPCTHLCPLRCHVSDSQHKNVKCSMCARVKELKMKAERKRAAELAQAREEERQADEERFKHQQKLEHIRKELAEKRRQAQQREQEEQFKQEIFLAELATDLTEKLQQTEAMQAAADRAKELEELQEALDKALAETDRLKREQQEQKEQLVQRRAEAEEEYKRMQESLDRLKANPEGDLSQLQALVRPKQKRRIHQPPQHREAEATEVASRGGGGGGGGASKPDHTELQQDMIAVSARDVSGAAASADASSDPWVTAVNSARCGDMRIVPVDLKYLQTLTNEFRADHLLASTWMGDIFLAQHPEVPDVVQGVLAVSEQLTAIAATRGLDALLRRPTHSPSFRKDSATCPDLDGYYWCKEASSSGKRGHLHLLFTLDGDQECLAKLLLEQHAAARFAWKFRLRAMLEVVTAFEDYGAMPPGCVFVSPPEYQVQILGLGHFQRRIFKEQPHNGALSSILQQLLTGEVPPHSRETNLRDLEDKGHTPLQHDKRCGEWEPQVVAQLKQIILDLERSMCSTRTAAQQLRKLVEQHGQFSTTQSAEITKALRQQVQHFERAHRAAQVESYSMRELKIRQQMQTIEASQRQCCICEDECKIQDGVECGGGATTPGDRLKSHFTCKDCIELHITNELQQPIAVLVNRNGGVFCPAREQSNKGCPCQEEPFSAKIIAQICSEEVYEAYQARLVDVKEQPRIEQMESDYEKRVAAEVERISKMTKEQLEVRKACARIHENILTLHCPACNAAFTDFNGCWALTCHNCDTSFCAACLQNCGADAHKHVAGCKAKPTRGVFGSHAEFKEVHRLRQEKMVNAFLKTLPANIWPRVLRNCEQSFADLKIKCVPPPAPNR